METSTAHIASPRVHHLAHTLPASCDLLGLERLLGAPAREWAPCGVSPFAKVQFDAGRTLIHEGARVTALYLVERGEAKIVRTEDDGYEQVCEFVGVGDLLGVESIFEGTHAHSVIAWTPLTLWSIFWQAVDALRQRFASASQASTSS